MIFTKKVIIIHVDALLPYEPYSLLLHIINTNASCPEGLVAQGEKDVKNPLWGANFVLHVKC